MGPAVPDPAYGEASAGWTEIYFNCADATWGRHGQQAFGVDGGEMDSGWVWPQQVEFRPVPQGNYLSPAYEIACGPSDTSGYAQIGPITLPELIKENLAMWKQSPSPLTR